MFEDGFAADDQSGGQDAGGREMAIEIEEHPVQATGTLREPTIADLKNGQGVSLDQCG
jgi:hypothetical protein